MGTSSSKEIKESKEVKQARWHHLRKRLSRPTTTKSQTRPVDEPLKVRTQDDLRRSGAVGSATQWGMVSNINSVKQLPAPIMHGEAVPPRVVHSHDPNDVAVSKYFEKGQQPLLEQISTISSSVSRSKPESGLVMQATQEAETASPPFKFIVRTPTEGPGFPFPQGELSQAPPFDEHTEEVLALRSSAQSEENGPSPIHGSTYVDPGWQDLSSASSSDSDDEEDWSAILDVRCELELSLNKEPPHLLPEKLIVQWYDPRAWDILDRKAWNWLAEQGISRDDRWHPTILRHGSFRIIGQEHESLPRKLFDKKNLPEVLVAAVFSFKGEYLHEPFSLRVRWDYESISIAQVPGEDYDSTIRNELSEKEKININGQMFFSSPVLNHILPDHAASLILEQDKSLELNETEMNNFRERLRKCRRLQTLCVWKRLSMKVLKNILDANPKLEDATLKQFVTNPTSEDIKNGLLRIDHGPLGPKNTDWKDFTGALPAIRPFHFPSRAQHRRNGTVDPLLEEDDYEIPKDMVLPICHEGGRQTVVGEGGFSRVIAVRIDPSYQVYTQDKNQLFALKCFKLEHSRRREHYAQERKVLAKLKRFHTAPQQRHLVTHYAAWSQELEFFILFPMATGTLETFMNYLPYPRIDKEPKYPLRFDRRCMPYDGNTKLPTLDSRFVDWFFTQLKGLAEALDHIHHLAADEDEEDNLPKRELVPQNIYFQRKGAQITGYHHDIKPDNILVFVDNRSDYGTMKFGDFGSANIQETAQNDPGLWTRSPVHTEKQKGTMTFRSPDRYCDGKLRRRADIWTLGCVFLEILIWCLEPRSKGLKSFATERAEEEAHLDYDSNSQVDQYWKVDEAAEAKGKGIKKAVLKDSVKNKFTDLKRRCEAKNMDAFEAVHRLTEQMMSTDSIKRIRSGTLATELGRQCANVKANLKVRADFYCGSVDATNVQPDTPYQALPPSPSSDGRTNVQGRSRSPSPHQLDRPTGHRRSLSVPERVREALANTDGKWLETLNNNADDALLAHNQPSDASLRGRSSDHLDAVDFPAVRSRSISSQRAAAYLRRHQSEPTKDQIEGRA
ncbi:hypothetical protein PV11_08271 [Exophiala sideris]|uniref:Protein kinase domain-containing protein n=1 Tax=Exophiala sideris TaxID=1016849 RepID=A0A0D1VWX3_9EURO|nr:hypothetical protein PV11_08271 [Exophiala sideris]